MAHRPPAHGPPGAAPDAGVAFPVVEGGRSTTATGRAVFADAARAIDAAIAEAIAEEQDWRRRYLVHIRRLHEAWLRADGAGSRVAEAGLASLGERFVFERAGATVPLAAASRAEPSWRLETRTVAGGGAGPRDGLVIPYRGEQLTGDALHRQLDRWCATGVIEPSCAESVRLVMANPDWLDLADQQFVLLGAGAEMGPLPALCRWGAHVVPVDVPSTPLWLRLLRAVRSGAGRASVPVRERPRDDGDESLADVAGGNLVTDLPELTAWLRTVEGPFTVGSYVYADGALHVRAALAADAVTAALAAERPGVGVALLATPTDVFAAPEEAVVDAQKRFATRQLRGLQELVRRATGGRLFAPNYDRLLPLPGANQVGLADCLVPQQGPNYALAKRLQRWRATAARARGQRASINIAPPTRTRSVMRNRILAAAYAGAGHFGVEVFDPPTSRTLMAVLLVHDLRNPQAAANPDVALRHPAEHVTAAASHGGLWRTAYAPRSVLGLAVLLGLPRRTA